jgi:hypothetical protein
VFGPVCLSVSEYVVWLVFFCGITFVDSNSWIFLWKTLNESPLVCLLSSSLLDFSVHISEIFSGGTFFSSVHLFDANSLASVGFFC